MSLTRIRTNTQALRSYNRLQQTYRNLAARQQRLATGKRISEAADDSAGYFIVNRLESKVRGQAAALANVGDAKSMLTVAEGGLEMQMEIFQNLKGKITQAASDTMDQRERTAIHRSVQKDLLEIEKIAAETSFNDKNLLDGSAGKKRFQVGAQAGEQFAMDLGAATLKTLGIEKSFEAKGTNLAEEFIPYIDMGEYGERLEAKSPYSSKADAEAALKDGRTFTLELRRVRHKHNDYDEAGRVTYWDVEFYTYESGYEESFRGLELFEEEPRPSYDGDPLLSDQTLGDENGAFDGALVDMGRADWTDFWQGDYTIDADTTYMYDGGDTDADPDTKVYQQYGNDHPNGSSLDGIEMTIRLGGNTLDVSTGKRARDSLERVDTAMETVSKKLADLGTAQKRLSFKADNLSTAKDNYASAKSRIIDADFAKEQLELTKLQILQQAGNGALTQANTAPQSVLGLLGGGGDPNGTGRLVDVYG